MFEEIRLKTQNGVSPQFKVSQDASVILQTLSSLLLMIIV